MNKSDLIAALSDRTSLSKADAGRCLDSLIDIIQASLQAGDAVTLPGFGSFSVKDRPARTGRNPQTGQEIAIQASRSPVFKPGKALKDCVNK